MKFDLTTTMKEIVEVLAGSVYAPESKVFAVGGAVRDTLLGVKPKDIDFCTTLTPPEIEEALKHLKLVVIPDKKARDHGILRFVDRDTGELIDIATLRKDVSCDGRHAEVEFTKDITEDLARRDFTINAMAVWLAGDCSMLSFIDPFNGQADLKQKILRFVGYAEDRIKEDYLRMLRYCRFKALGEGWGDSQVALNAIQTHAAKIKTVSKERIRDEVVKALSYSKPSAFFRTMAETGLLDTIFPDLARGIGCEQNVHHAEPVFDHLLRCLDASVGLTDNVLLRLASLTHDIAKPHTKGVGADGDATFYKHEVVGASIMYNWMKDLKFSNKEVEYVVKLVRHHQWRFEDDTKDKTIRKWLQEVGKDTWRDLITLRCADRLGNLKKAGKAMITTKMRELMDKVETMIASGVPIFKEDLAINGDDVRALGVPPGKVYKEIFSNLLGIVTNDPKKNTKDWLSTYVTKNYVEKVKNDTAGRREG